MKMLYATSPKIKPGWVDYTNFTMLMWAVESSNPDMLAFLLSKASSTDLAKTDNESKTALHWAAHFGKYEFCKLILDFDSSYGYDSGINNILSFYWYINNIVRNHIKALLMNWIQMEIALSI